MATINNITTASRFHNLSPAMLADWIGDLDRKAKAATTELEAAKAHFKALGIPAASGNAYSIDLDTSIRQTLDTAKVKAAMGQAWCDDMSRLGEVVSLRIKAIPQATAIAA